MCWWIDEEPYAGPTYFPHLHFMAYPQDAMVQNGDLYVSPRRYDGRAEGYYLKYILFNGQAELITESEFLKYCEEGGIVYKLKPPRSMTSFYPRPSSSDDYVF